MKTITDVCQTIGSDINTLNKRTVMTKAEFEALAAARREMFAGSGLLGEPKVDSQYHSNDNDHIWIHRYNDGNNNNLQLGRFTKFNVPFGDG